TATTAGRPYSRATTALWVSIPPWSVTSAAAVAKSGVHVWDVMGATSTSPGWKRVASRMLLKTRALPRATPGEPGVPVSVRARVALGASPSTALGPGDPRLVDDVPASGAGAAGSDGSGMGPNSYGTLAPAKRSNSAWRSATSGRR